MTDKSLLKLKVIELCDFVAGPYCTRLLADFGGEVIKIERPGIGDSARKRGPFPGDIPDPEKSGMFLYLNTNKSGVTLDVESADGNALFRKLIADADILVEDRAPGEMQRLGLCYEALKAINPNLIMTSITVFGQTGPYRDYKSYHLNTYHASGAGYMLPMNSTSLTREPLRGPGFTGDYDGGVSAALATMAALYWRRHGGTGQHIDVSIQHSIMHLERSQLRRYVDSGVSPNRTGMGRLLESLVECKDGNYVILILSSEKQWQGLYKAMGEPEWGRDTRFNSQAARSANYEALRAKLSEWTKAYTAQEVFEMVQAEKSACSPAQTAEQFYNSPQTLQRNYFDDVEHPVAGTLRHPGLPYQFSAVPKRTMEPAPLLGQHNEAVFAGQLGLDRRELVRLRQAGVI